MESTIIPEFNKLNRTFARRIGKRLSNQNKELLANVLPKYLFSNELLAFSGKQKKYLEIGFGMGEHLFNQVVLNPANLYIGVEVYLNGIANFLKLVAKSQNDNFLIWPNDLDMILKDIPNRSLEGIYVLFPDPWHKRRYMKKRLINKERLELLKLKLKIGGFIAFASDIEDYFENVKKLFLEDKVLNLQNTDFLIPHEGYITTKYHWKSIRENRVARFLQAILSEET
jgi:release factor glutamine methyltransferase